MTGLIHMQFVGSTTWSSTLIKWFGHGLPVSHVDTVLPDGICDARGVPHGSLLGARSERLGAPAGGVQIRPPDYETWSYRLTVPLPCPDAIADKYHEFVLSQVGKPYDGVGLISNFIFGRDWRRADSWWCSELNARGLEPDVSGYLARRLASPSNKIDPASLILVLSALVPLPQDLRRAARLHAEG